MNSIVYDVERVTKFYPGQSRPANREISLQIREGEIFGFLGDNGAGKTTLVRQMVLGPVTGRIALDFAVLAGASILIFGIVLAKLDWRQK